LIIAEQAGDDDADDADDADGVDEQAASSRNAQEASAEMAIICPIFTLARLLAQILYHRPASAGLGLYHGQQASCRCDQDFRPECSRTVYS
jgi:hypothetical protein